MRVDVPYKRKTNKVKIILEEDFIKQPFLKLYAKLKGNTNGINKPHADKSGTRDFEKHMFCCVSMCLKKEQIRKSESYWRRISSSNHFWNYMPNSREILMESQNHMLTKVCHGILKRRLLVACRCALTIIQSKSCWMRISSSNHSRTYMPNSKEIQMTSTKHMLTKVGHGILKRRFVVACRCALNKQQWSQNHIGGGFHQATIPETIC